MIMIIIMIIIIIIIPNNLNQFKNVIKILFSLISFGYPFAERTGGGWRNIENRIVKIVDYNL